MGDQDGEDFDNENDDFDPSEHEQGHLSDEDELRNEPILCKKKSLSLPFVDNLPYPVSQKNAFV